MDAQTLEMLIDKFGGLVALILGFGMMTFAIWLANRK